MVYEPFDANSSGMPFEDEAALLASTLLDRHEAKVDGILKTMRIGVGKKASTKSLRRLDNILMAVASASGAAKGIAVAGRRNLKIPKVLMNRLSSMGLLTTTVIYILAHARVRNISSTDPRVQTALKTALVASMSLPIGNVIVENLGRLARPSIGMPTDPRTVLALAASGAAGGVAGGTFARAIVEAVNTAFGQLPEVVDTEVDEETDPEPVVVAEIEAAGLSE